VLDEIDGRIIELLRENGRATYVDIAREVGLSEGAVRNRVQSLLDSGIIMRFTVELTPSAAVRGLTMISVDPSKPTSAISQQVEEISDVERIYEVTGEYDIVTVIASSGIEQVNRCIEKIRGIDGVVKTNTMIVLRTY
jgi:Lrp/AsnC family transcriptional regulator of lysine biosynthesis